MNEQISLFAIETFRSAFGLMRPILSDYASFTREMSRVVRVKEGGNIQYSFDVAIDGIVKENLVKFGVTGRIYSEESGFFDNGPSRYRVVYDPFCNSSLAARAFHDAALGLTVFSYGYDFIASFVMDYQTGIVAAADERGTRFFQVQTQENIAFDNPPRAKLEDAWVVLTLENRAERGGIDMVGSVLDNAKRILVGSGHIYWLRLAAGLVDAYADPVGGEPLYEMFACSVAQRSGCVVTDWSGEIFDGARFLKTFEADPSFVYRPIAATNVVLHGEIMSALSAGGGNK